MLPNLRLVPVGGVFFAIVIVALHLAFGWAQTARALVVPVDASARGALMARDEHPEWRQFLILAATRRAGEIERLRELPDTPAPVGKPQIAAVPDNRDEADPDEATSPLVENPSAVLPLDIGETSSTELPIGNTPEQPPVIRVPQQGKPPHQSRKALGHRAQVRTPATDLWTLLFGPLPAATVKSEAKAAATRQ